MRRLFLFISCVSIVFILNGCNVWKNKIEVSKLKIDDGYIIGKVRNVTNKAYDTTLIFELKSGSLKIEEKCYETFKPNKTKDLECILDENVDDSYNVKLKNIELEEITIPKLNEGKIDDNTLKYHFEDIYSLHTLNFLNFNASDVEEKYPFIENIEYKGNEIRIESKLTQNENFASFVTEYNAINSDLEYLFFAINSDCDEEFVNQIFSGVSRMHPFSPLYSIDIEKALQRTDIPSDECVLINEWCISPTYNHNDLLNSFSIHKQ